MDLTIVRFASLIAISLIYMLFDVFNRRNIPSAFAYASVIYGAILTLLYLNIAMIAESAGIALLVLGAGYLIYKYGQLGAADVTEFAALSLILPIQGIPLLYHANQLSLPFIISLIINSGIASFFIILVYYLPKAKKNSEKPLLSYISQYDLIKATVIAVAYLFFIFFLSSYTGFYLPGVAMLSLIAIVSIAIMLFEKPLTNTMISYITVKDFEEGDIIAFNLMSKEEIERLRQRIPNFGRLVDQKLITEMKKLKIEMKIPVYKAAMPLALPIFIGVCLSLLCGDLILFMLPLIYLLP
ncbi:MAG: hypothetical protein ACP5SJ_01255 [Candidatus Micrarchaeia archaeon]